MDGLWFPLVVFVVVVLAAYVYRQTARVAVALECARVLRVLAGPIEAMELAEVAKSAPHRERADYTGYAVRLLQKRGYVVVDPSTGKCSLTPHGRLSLEQLTVGMTPADWTQVYR